MSTTHSIMKTLRMKGSLLISILLMSFITSTDTPIDRLGVSGPLEFNNTTFKLAWTDHPNENYYIQEYLPEEEEMETFSQMLTIHLFDTDLSAKRAAGQKIQELIERKKTDAVCNYQINESPDGMEVIVDFLLGEEKDDVMTIVEFNVYRYKQIELSPEDKAIVVYAYTKRSYGNDIRSFLNTLKTERVNRLNEMIAADIPVVTIEKK